MAVQPIDPPATSAPDGDKILRVVQLYVDGFNDGDRTKFEEAFHIDAWIFFTGPDGTLYRNQISANFESWAAQKSCIGGRVLSVIQAGDVASVLLGYDDLDDLDLADPASNDWVDFHTLLRIDGVWKITNKTATHQTRAAWASRTHHLTEAPSAPDRDEIVGVVQYYIDGCNNGGDISLWHKAFHPDASIFCTEPSGSLEQGRWLPTTGRIYDEMDGWAAWAASDKPHIDCLSYQ